MKANEGTHGFKWRLFATGMIAIILGFILLGAGNTALAPLLLVAGYCVLVPLAFL
jgi:hypothetical protein